MDFVKKYRNTIIVIVVVLVAVVAIFAYRGQGTPTSTNDNADVLIETPQAGEIITSPLTIRGKARGTWFFEANLPIKLLDADGNVLAQVGAQAEGEWMTTEFVPFAGELTFQVPATETGTLRIMKDNPSDRRELDRSFDVPVQFGATSDKIGVQVFFENSKLNPSGDLGCDKSFSTTRVIPKTVGVARAAIEELLRGPTAEEKEKGYLTDIPLNVKLQNISLRGGVLYLDFSSELNNYGGGSCRVGAIYSEITNTAKQFPTVKEVKISINGSTEDILQP